MAAPEVKELKTIAKSASARHRWRIENFSLLKSAVGEFIDSEEFTVLDHKWKFRVCPGGQRPESKGMVGFYAVPIDVPDSVDGELMVSLVRPASGEAIHAAITQVTWKNGQGYGFHNVLSRQDLLDETKGFCLNDVVIFEASIKTINLLQGDAILAPPRAFLHEDYPPSLKKWTIHDFSKRSGQIKSENFTGGGDTVWNLLLDFDTKGSVELHLASKNELTEQAKFELSILAQNGDSLFRRSTRAYHAIGRTDATGWTDFIARSELLAPEKKFMVDDTLILQANVTVRRRISEQITEKETDSRLDLSALLAKPTTSDTKIIASGGEEFFVHRCILVAHSPVFETMFQAKMLESQDHQIHLDDIDKETVAALVHFMYTGGHKQQLTLAALVPTFSVAHRFELGKLHDICSAKLARILSAENLATLYLLSEEYENTLLKSECARYVELSPKRDALLLEVLKSSRPKAVPATPMCTTADPPPKQLPTEVSSSCCVIS